VDSEFPQVSFSGELRPSQADVVEIARQQLGEGKRRLHIVAPPGSGKTVLGLYLWALNIRCPAVVFSPNSAIQMQWAARTDLFELASGEPLESYASTDPKQLKLLNSLTYQSVTLPRRGGDDLDDSAMESWIARLIDKEQAENPREAEAWIEDLARRNPDYYEQRMSIHRKKVRDKMALAGDAIETLHHSAIDTLHRLKDAQVGLVILDECHHLLGHWGRVLADVDDLLGRPIIIGLTATPPDKRGRSKEDLKRYDKFFGPIDYEIPLPAVVKDGFLAPYQDLVYFVRPTAEELGYIANTDEAFTSLVEGLCTEPERMDDQFGNPDAATGMKVGTLPQWTSDALEGLKLGVTTVSNWREFQRRDPAFAYHGPLLLKSLGYPLPSHVPDVKLPDDVVVPSIPTDLDLLVPLLDRYVRHGLRRSELPEDQERGEQVIRSLRALGVQVTETGHQHCASPVGRVMAYSQSKINALVPILVEEQRVLGEAIRAVVITDYEKTSAVTAEIKHLLDEESGGAIAAFKKLVSDVETDSLDPVLVTGSTVLVDDDLAEHFLESSSQWLLDNGGNVELKTETHDGFVLVKGKGSDWSPRLYVRLITELFQQGVTRCLVGTRGLLGEGWDANRINVLIDLTAATTSMTVNQLRGRSIRLDPLLPEKLADNWDVICLAPEFHKGLDDYARFSKKHNATYGVCEDGAIEKGPGHVHAAFTKMKPENVEGTATVLNDEMIGRISRRAEARQLWRIGEPYEAIPVKTTEISSMTTRGGFPPFSHKQPWSDKSLAKAIGEAVLLSLDELGLIAPTGLNTVKARQPWRKIKSPLKVMERAGGYVRVFLEDTDDESALIFNEALREVLGPLDDPRYVIPRQVDYAEQTLLSRLLPGALGRLFVRFERKLAMLHAVPRLIARHKKSVGVFQKHWNDRVSPGEAVYMHKEEGKKLVEQARLNDQLPKTSVRDKEVFLTTGDAPTKVVRQQPIQPESVQPKPIQARPVQPKQVRPKRAVAAATATARGKTGEVNKRFAEQIQQVGLKCFPDDQQTLWETVNVEQRDGVFWVEAIPTPHVGYPRIKFVMKEPDPGTVIAAYCLEDDQWSLLFTARTGFETVPTIMADLEKQ
jgi:superfamily II DNA or RNA helicase